MAKQRKTHLDRNGQLYSHRLVDMPEYIRDNDKYDESAEFLNLLYHGLKLVKADGAAVDYRRARFVVSALVNGNRVGYMRAGDIFAYVDGKDPDEYNFPRNLRMHTARGTVFPERPASYSPKENGNYILYGLPYYFTLREMVDDGASELSNVRNAIRQNLNACRSPKFWLVKDKDTKNSMEQVVEQTEDGAPNIVVAADFENGVKGVEMSVQYLVNEMHDYETSVRDRLLNKIGIMSANTDKRERVQVGEVNATLGQCLDYVGMLVENFNTQCEVYGIPYRLQNNTSTQLLYMEEDEEQPEEQPEEESEDETV